SIAYVPRANIAENGHLHLRHKQTPRPLHRNVASLIQSSWTAFGSVPAGVFRLPVSSQNDKIFLFWGQSVKTITATAANKLGKFLAKDFRRVFGPAHNDVAERLGSLARSSIECLARSDALYHNYEHTLQVTMVGRDILQGMRV